MAAFNTRWLKKNLFHVMKLSSEVARLGLTETKLKESDEQALEALDGTVNASLSDQLYKGYGG